jgi:hypothetical protein
MFVFYSDNGQGESSSQLTQKGTSAWIGICTAAQSVQYPQKNTGKQNCMYTGTVTPTDSDLIRLDGGADADMFQYNNWEGTEKEGEENKRGTEQKKKDKSGWRPR